MMFRCVVFCFLCRLSVLWSKVVLLVSSMISFVLYPRCFSLWMSLSFMWSKVVLLELVLRYTKMHPFVVSVAGQPDD